MLRATAIAMSIGLIELGVARGPPFTAASLVTSTAHEPFSDESVICQIE